MTDNTVYLVFGLGFGSGGLCVFALIYLPVRSWARSATENRMELDRLMAPYRVAVETDLADAISAKQQAQAAYMPLYPGNTGRYDDPDPAWLAWIAEYGEDYWRPRRPATLHWRAALIVVCLAVLWRVAQRRDLQATLHIETTEWRAWTSVRSS